MAPAHLPAPAPPPRTWGARRTAFSSLAPSSVPAATLPVVGGYVLTEGADGTTGISADTISRSSHARSGGAHGSERRVQGARRAADAEAPTTSEGNGTPGSITGGDASTTPGYFNPVPVLRITTLSSG